MFPPASKEFNSENDSDASFTPQENPWRVEAVFPVVTQAHFQFDQKHQNADYDQWFDDHIDKAYDLIC